MTAPVSEEVLTAVVAVGLPGSLCEPPRDELSEQEAAALVAIARRHRIAGMVLASVRAGGLRLPPAAVRALLALHGPEVAGSRRLESELVWVAGVLDGVGIGSRVLGDVALVRLDYRDSALRAVAAIELLVRPADINQAIQVLRGRGWQAHPDRHGGAMLDSPAGLRLECHTTVHPMPPGVTVDGQALWGDRRELRIGDRKLVALGEEQRLLHACCRAAGDDPGPARLLRQRDVAEAVLFGAWDRARLMRLAVSWNAEEVLAHAVRTAWQRLAIADVTGLSVWAGAGHQWADGQPRRDGTPAGARARSPVPPTWRRKLQARPS
ncbi:MULTISPECIES: nucleotidyltransferase family protein [unclassified Blastococcus]